MQRAVAGVGLVLALAGSRAAVAAEMDKVSLYGFFDVEFEYALSEDGGDQNGSFDAHHFNVFSDYRVADDVAFRSQIEWEHAFVSNEGGVLRVHYAFIEYRIQDWLRVRPGRLLTPFGIYSEFQDSTPAFPSYSFPSVVYKSSNLGGFRFQPRWTTGFAVLGDLPTNNGTFHYDLYLGNGTNVEAWDGQADDNFGKAVGTNLHLESFGGWMLHGSAMYEMMPVESGGEVSGEVPHAAFLVGGGFGDKLGVEVEAAYAYQDTDDQLAAHALVRYTFKDDWTPYFRASILNPGVDTTGDEHIQLETGVNYQIRPGFVLKLDELHVIGREDAHYSKSYDEIRTAVALAF